MDCRPWTAISSIAGRVFTPGAIAGSFTSSPLLLLDALEGANSITDFTLAPLWESGGFTLGWTAPHDPDGVGALAATEALFMRSYTAGGLALEVLGPAIFHQVRDASNMSMAGIVGDRIVAVYQDNATTGIRAISRRRSLIRASMVSVSRLS